MRLCGFSALLSNTGRQRERENVRLITSQVVEIYGQSRREREGMERERERGIHQSEFQEKLPMALMKFLQHI